MIYKNGLLGCGQPMRNTLAPPSTAFLPPFLLLTTRVPERWMMTGEGPSRRWSPPSIPPVYSLLPLPLSLLSPFHSVHIFLLGLLHTSFTPPPPLYFLISIPFILLFFFLFYPHPPPPLLSFPPSPFPILPFLLFLLIIPRFPSCLNLNQGNLRYIKSFFFVEICRNFCSRGEDLTAGQASFLCYISDMFYSLLF